jgi:hypothetical protein
MFAYSGVFMGSMEMCVYIIRHYMYVIHAHIQAHACIGYFFRCQVNILKERRHKGVMICRQKYEWAVL